MENLEKTINIERKNYLLHWKNYYFIATIDYG